MDLQAEVPERPARLGRIVRVGGRRVHVLTQGRGRPIVLLHGNGSMGEEIQSAFPLVPGVQWIAPDRPGYGRSDPLPQGQEDPVSQARWLEALLDRLDLSSVTLVAHSLAAGLALALAGARPDRVERLVLLSPFCRPTQEKWMPFLRIASAPFVGEILCRTVLPPVMRRMRGRLIQGIMTPNRPPPWLERLPLTQAARPASVRMMAAELKAFNAGMRQIARNICLRQPVAVVHGLSDRTAEPAWHLPWLRRLAPGMRCVLLRNCGHAVHHAAPNLVLRIVVNGHLAVPRAGIAPWMSSLPQAEPEEPNHARHPCPHPDQHSGYTLA